MLFFASRSVGILKGKRSLMHLYVPSSQALAKHLVGVQKGCFGCNIAFPVSQTKRAFVQGSVLSATALEELAQNWEMARLHLQLDEQIHTFWMQM